MHRTIGSLTLVLALCLLLFPISRFGTGAAQTASSPAPSALPSFAEPSISPDRSEIAFASGGDIWTVPASGGEARLILSHPANDGRPLFSPDGRTLAFMSTRTGNGDIYLLGLQNGELKRLTFDDAFEQLDSWSRDGKWIYFSSTSRDISGMNDIFRVSVEGGTPMQVSADRYATEYWSVPSPDGQTLAFTARGSTSTQWWRKGRSHLDECEIWLMKQGAPPTYERLSEGGARGMWPMWSNDARTVFYVSDRTGVHNIWAKPLNGTPRQVTKFNDGRVLWPAISYDGRTIVFERNFAIWRMDVSNGEATEVRITRRGMPAGPGVEHLRLTDQIQELALSPDGKKVAFVVRGEVFAASAKDGGDAARVTTSPANEFQIAWAPDSRRLVYVSDRDGVNHIYSYDFKTSAESQLTRDAAADSTPEFSPDGKLLAFERDGRELHVLDMESKQQRKVAAAYFQRPPLSTNGPFAWSPDSKWIAFVNAGNKSFRNVHVVSLESGREQQITFLSNIFTGNLTWSPDGTFLMLTTAQRTEDGQVARVDLIPRTPKFREDQFRDLFKEETPRNLAPSRPPAPPAPPAQSAETPEPPRAADQQKPAVKPVEIEFEGIRRRLTLLPVGVDVNLQTISRDGKWLLMNASAAGQQNLYTYSLDELSREPAVARQLTSTPGFKSDAQFSPDGKEVFYLQQGRINSIPVESRQPRQLAVIAELDVDFSQEKLEVFSQAWSYLRDYFYDPNYHGVNWNLVKTQYEPRIRGARNPDEMRRLMQLMVGELNASHTGVSGPFGGNQPAVGRLGVRFDHVEYETQGRLRITEIVPLGPVAVARDIKIGDYLLAVDGTPISSQTNLDELLSFKIGRRVLLTVASGPDGTSKREVAIRPVNLQTEKGLLYRKWVDERREYVAKMSGGRLGYVHMFDMSGNSLAQLYLDLDSENHAREGVVVDVRNNNGGFVNAYAIDVLARRPYMTMTIRGFPSSPARTMLGQRALELPTILVTNQHSLSDAEDFTEGYRALKLGKVVGEPTAGWIIYTTNVSLIDGTTIRLPFIRITSGDGKLMELSPRPVDIPVRRPIGESLTDRDSQLDAAVRELLAQLGTREAGKVGGSK
jgi:Tol biopolymer transport system component/C-terminal processing protease CtpA/Prc